MKKKFLVLGLELLNPSNAHASTTVKLLYGWVYVSKQIEVKDLVVWLLTKIVDVKLEN
jgi:hypothetical protein